MSYGPSMSPVVIWRISVPSFYCYYESAKDEKQQRLNIKFSLIIGRGGGGLRVYWILRCRDVLKISIAITHKIICNRETKLQKLNSLKTKFFVSGLLLKTLQIKVEEALF